MEKTKKLLLLVVLFVTAFLVATRVSAKAAWGFEKAGLICDPQVLEAGGSSSCYYLGKAKTGSDYESANAGFYLLLYTTQNLKLKDVKVNSNLDKNKTGAILVTLNGTSSQTITNVTSTMPEGLAKFKCNFAGHTSKDKNKTTSGCGVFYSTKGAGEQFAPGSMSLYGYLTNHKSAVTKIGLDENAAVLGTIEVELPKNNNLEGCGDLCIATFGVAKEADWGHADCTNTSGTSEWNGDSCGSANVTSFTQPSVNANMVDGDFACYELTLKTVTPHNTKTGAFVSYAILAAGALIAISAVTIAKKHNRLQKI